MLKLLTLDSGVTESFFRGGGGQSGARPSSGGGARERHRNEGCTINSQMGEGNGGGHGVNGGGGHIPPGPSIVTSTTMD